MNRSVPLVLAVLAAAGCSAAPAAHHHRTPQPPPFTAAQGASACADIQKWLDVAWSQDMPRFDATMSADETAAAGTQLGADLATLDVDTQTENSAALLPGPPGYPTDIGALQSDCSGYGVTVRYPQP